MTTHQKILISLILSGLIATPLLSQNDVKFGDKKIKIPGSEICSYSLNSNSHIDKDFLEIKNGRILYTVVEYDNSIPVHIEITECDIADLDKSSCSLAFSDLKSTLTPGQVYVLYLYTVRDRVNISTTIYESPNQPATIQNTSVSRLHFRNEHEAQLCFETYFK